MGLPNASDSPESCGSCHQDLVFFCVVCLGNCWKFRYFRGARKSLETKVGPLFLDGSKTNHLREFSMYICKNRFWWILNKWQEKHPSGKGKHLGKGKHHLGKEKHPTHKWSSWAPSWHTIKEMLTLLPSLAGRKNNSTCVAKKNFPQFSIRLFATMTGK